MKDKARKTRQERQGETIIVTCEVNKWFRWLVHCWNSSWITWVTLGKSSRTGLMIVHRAQCHSSGTKWLLSLAKFHGMLRV